MGSVKLFLNGFEDYLSGRMQIPKYIETPSESPSMVSTGESA